MRFNLPFGHVGGLPESIDELPGFHDKPKYELDSWEKAERDRKELNSDRRGADHGDSLPSMPPTRRRKRRNWESPASFEHQEAYILDPKPFQDATARRRTQTRVICSFRINESNKPIRKALMTFISSCTEMVEWVQRLGLPANSIRTKLPYHRCAACAVTLLFPCAQYVHSKSLHAVTAHYAVATICMARLCM